MKMIEDKICEIKAADEIQEDRLLNTVVNELNQI